MTTNKINKSTEEWANVWQKNGIPQLEFCSIERSAELLNCLVDDIYHWINMGMIHPAVFFENHVAVNITAYVKGEEITEEEILYKVRKAVKRPSIIDFHWSEKATLYDTDGVNQNIEYFENENCKYENGRNILTRNGTIYGLWLPSFFDRWSGETFQIIDYQNSIFLPDDSEDESVVLVASLKDNIEVNSNNLLIINKDIDRIYKAGQAGAILSEAARLEVPEQKNEHKATARSKERALAMERGIYKFLFNSDEESDNYKFKDGKINKTKLIQCMRDKSHHLFNSEKMPLNDKDKIMPIIDNVLKNLNLS
ncbi:hypothetical protein AB7W97_11400 [Providencia rettgeri]|uniref:hypothetical protein n=1 Tax=unclassified Providencia TaxID=2633465 RepID=UPI00234B8104|nr:MULTISPECIES: hypothetical protein [unclassified Providencia]